MTGHGDVRTDSALDGATAYGWMLGFVDRVERDSDELTELDRIAGDGDFGWNVASASRRARGTLGSTGLVPPDAFQAMSDAFLDAGGTSGPLFGLWFGRLAAGPRRDWSTPDLAEAVRDATEAVQRLGGAEQGDRTMVDALVPASLALHANAAEPWPVALHAAAEAAASGAEATRRMLARRGRATYVGERALDVVDPGALAVAWLFAAAREASA